MLCIIPTLLVLSFFFNSRILQTGILQTGPNEFVEYTAEQKYALEYQITDLSIRYVDKLRLIAGRSTSFSDTLHNSGERKWVERNGSNRPPVPWVESSPFRNWVEWTWVDLENRQVQGRQHIDFDPSPFDPIRPQLFDQKGRPNSFRPISFDPFHAIRIIRLGMELLSFLIELCG